MWSKITGSFPSWMSTFEPVHEYCMLCTHEIYQNVECLCKVSGRNNLLIYPHTITMLLELILTRLVSFSVFPVYWHQKEMTFSTLQVEVRNYIYSALIQPHGIMLLLIFISFGVITLIFLLTRYFIFRFIHEIFVSSFVFVGFFRWTAFYENGLKK